MSLLILNHNEELQKIANMVVDVQFERDARIITEYDERRKRRMIEDALYNLTCLHTAIIYEADAIFLDYARWVYTLLIHRMPDIARERVRQHMIMHYEILMEAVACLWSEKEVEKAVVLLKDAISITEEVSIEDFEKRRFDQGKYTQYRKAYLNCLLAGNRQGATDVIDAAVNAGVALDEVYIHILQEVMIEVGGLWHRNQIGVDKEHYCTAITQGILTRYYAQIFSTPRRGRTLLACCVGNELHEMGIRMLCDIFEFKGWDSIYLGAAVPVDGILKSIRENRPDLTALSVTMTHHLEHCHQVLRAIREDAELKHIKIAIGGRAFHTSTDLWKKWGADISVHDALQLFEWADANIQPLS